MTDCRKAPMRFSAVRRDCLHGPDMGLAAARVVVSVRRIVFHLATCYPYQSLLRHAVRSVAFSAG